MPEDVNIYVNHYLTSKVSLTLHVI